jgi:Tol biopolymer transport system component
MRRVVIFVVPLVLVLIATGSLANAAPAAQLTAPSPRKLSGTMPAFGDVSGPAHISPDGLYAVYRADQETDGVLDLWSVRLDGSQPPVKLNGLLPAGKFVRSDFAITPLGRVVYAAEQDVAGRYDLYSVPLSGGTLTRLSDPAVIGDDVNTFLITPDGTRVVFNATGLTGRNQLYSVATTGGTVTTLIPPPVLGGFASDLKLTPNGQWLLFIGDIQVNSRFELFRVPVLGGPVDKLSGPLAAGGSVISYALSPDGIRVAYVAGQDTADQFEVYSVLMAGAVMPSTSDRAEEQSTSLSTQAAGVKLNPSFPAQADAGDALWISPDSAYVLYTADVNIDEAFELYSVPIDGGTAVQLNGALVTEGDVDTATAPLFSADSRTVIYRADQQTNDRYELYAVPITGGPALKVNDPVSGYGITLARLSPNGNHLIFGGQSGGATHERLWSKPMGLGPVVDLFPGLALDDTIDSFCATFSPDGRWLAFSVHDLTTQDGVAYVTRVKGDLKGTRPRRPGHKETTHATLFGRTQLPGRDHAAAVRYRRWRARGVNRM